MNKWLAFVGFVLVIAMEGVNLSCEHASRELVSTKYRQAVLRFADTVIDHGRDNYGEVHSPLFVDGLRVDSLTPARWKAKDGSEWVLSNFASQQPLMRLLDGLSGLTGVPKYRQAAEQTAQYVLTNLRTPNGLLYWGGHTAWDLERDRAVGYRDAIINLHEMKMHQPYFELMHRVDQAATRKLAESIWTGHVLDWNLLDYNRHAHNDRDCAPGWDDEFNADIEVPFSTDNENLSFCNVTPPLMQAGVSLALLDNQPKALIWTRRLVQRWQQASDPSTGLSGGQLSYRKEDRAQIALGHVHPNINEASIVADYHQNSRYHKLPLTQMQAAEWLIASGGESAEMGRQFIEWASEDLLTYAEQCFDPDSGVFTSRMTDGTPIRWREAKAGYYVPESFAPMMPDGYILCGYAMAYRLTGNERHWEMIRSLCKVMKLGDPGRSGDQFAQGLNLQTSSEDWLTIYAMLDLHRATGQQAFLRLACRIADNLLESQTDNGLFPRRGRVYARTGDELPLAILHLAAAIEDRREALPRPILDNAYFHAVYYGELDPYQQKRDDERTYDFLVFYGPR